MKVSIEALDHQGRGIAKNEGKIYFVENAVPGEIVEVKVTKCKKNICECKVEKFHNINEEARAVPKCPYYGECGGCDIMHIKNQNQYKIEKLNNIINKYVDKDIKVKEVESLNNYNYRNKITLQIKDNKIGLYKKQSNDIVEINECLLVNNKINKIIKLIKENFSLQNIKQIVIKAMTDETMVVINTNKDVNINVDILKTEATSIYVNDKKVFGKEKIIEKMDNYKFLVSPESFFQVNTLVATNMYNYIKSLITDSDVLFDLYCGTGTIGIFASSKAKKIVGIEINESAVNDANENKKINNVKNIEFFCTDASKIIEKTNLKPNCIIVDPPRSGLDKKMIEDIKCLKPQQIIYISCDPMTLSRDLKLLSEYEIQSIKGFDMFPNTYHVECVSNLKLK